MVISIIIILKAFTIHKDPKKHVNEVKISKVGVNLKEEKKNSLQGILKYNVYYRYMKI